MWPLLDPRRLDETYDLWLAYASQTVAQARSSYSADAREYLSWLGISSTEAEALSELRLAVSMHVTTVATIKRGVTEGLTLEQAARLGLRRSFGSAERHSLDASRSVVARSSVADPAVVGWRRVGRGGCDFCRMLIGRGAVYRAETVSFRSHDHCHCMAEPSFEE